MACTVLFFFVLVVSSRTESQFRIAVRVSHNDARRHRNCFVASGNKDFFPNGEYDDGVVEVKQEAEEEEYGKGIAEVKQESTVDEEPARKRAALPGLSASGPGVDRLRKLLESKGLPTEMISVENAQACGPVAGDVGWNFIFGQASHKIYAGVRDV